MGPSRRKSKQKAFDLLKEQYSKRHGGACLKYLPLKVEKAGLQEIPSQKPNQNVTRRNRKIKKNSSSSIEIRSHFLS